MKARERRNKQNEKQGATLQNLAEEKRGDKGESESLNSTDDGVTLVSVWCSHP